MAASSSSTATQVLKDVQAKATNIIKGASEMDLRGIMRMHAFTSILLGVGTLLLPHAFLGSGYSHFSHEFIRLYGCLTLSIGWVSTPVVSQGHSYCPFHDCFYRSTRLKDPHFLN